MIEAARWCGSNWPDPRKLLQNTEKIRPGWGRIVNAIESFGEAPKIINQRRGDKGPCKKPSFDPMGREDDDASDIPKFLPETPQRFHPVFVFE
jgi:hypothetical protein